MRVGLKRRGGVSLLHERGWLNRSRTRLFEKNETEKNKIGGEHKRFGVAHLRWNFECGVMATELFVSRAQVLRQLL